jgi:hypothetical protein
MTVSLLPLGHAHYAVSKSWQRLLVASQYLGRWQRPPMLQFTPHHAHGPLDIGQRLHHAWICDLANYWFRLLSRDAL